MKHVVLSAVVVSSATLVGVLIFSIAQPTLSVWPAPHEHGRAWRVRLIVHRVAGALVALAGAGALALSVLDHGSLHLPASLRWLVGPTILGFGAMLGLWGYLRLGADASGGWP